MPGEQTDALAPLTVFVSYAHEDESGRQRLEAHLSLLRRQGLIADWHDRQILAGDEWARDIDQHLETASIILLLISPDFLASDYCYGIEMQRALARQQRGEARVIPILLRSVDWQSAAFGKLAALPSNGKPISQWRDRNKAFADVAQGIRKALQDVQRLAVSTPSTSFRRVCNIPYPRNPVFTGRVEVLKRLYEVLRAGKTAALGQLQAISGLGGIGKTQIAMEYAYRYQDDYNFILWVKAETRDSLISDFVSIATLLNPLQKQEQEQHRIVEAVKRWFQDHIGWLLIFDNADDLAMIRDFLPSGGKGHILLTTRAYATGRMAQRIEVAKMEPEEGALFLLRRATILDADAPLDSALKTERDIAREIVQAMDGLPLALDQAGAYIEETGCGLQGYLQLYQAQGTCLLKERGEFVSDHPDPVATTWSLSFEKVEQANAAAAELLRFCAFLSPDAIPEELFTESAVDLGPTLEPMATDPSKFNAAIKELLKYSLVQRDPESNTLSIHRLVQEVLKDQMDENTQRQWAERTVKALNRLFPDVWFEVWSLCERCLPHVLVCATRIKQWDMAFPEAGRLLHEAGFYLSVRARYSQALPLLQRALAIREKALGPTHPDTVSSLSVLAWFYSKQGQYAEAEPLFQQALVIREQQLGAEHPDTATSLNDLAALYRAQGRYAEADPLLKGALAIREKVLGPEHPSVAQVLSNLALLYAGQGKDTEAFPLLQRALAIREKAFGPTFPDTASSLSNLAWFYSKQGQYAEALPLYQRALAIDEQELGPDHLEVATDLTDLARFYAQQGQYAQAEPLFQRALAIRERQVGAEHRYTATSLYNLAWLYQEWGKDELAEPLFQRALAIREQQLGVEHSDTATSLNALAVLYHNQGKDKQAEPLYQRALAIREKELGPEHPDTLVVRGNYGSLLRTMGRDAEATLLETDGANHDDVSLSEGNQ